MSFTIYEAAYPPVIRMLENLGMFLDKGAEYCAARKIEMNDLLNYRLAPDMYPLFRQIHLATDGAKGMAARLGGVDVPSYPDVETTVEELKARLAKTIAFVSSITPAQVEGAEGREIVLKTGGVERRMTGRDFLIGFALPNFYFHAATAYDILRHAGVDLGKRDFLALK
jgi:uncharacterized protein